MKVKELIIQLMENSMNAEVSIDCDFSDALEEDEGLDLKRVEPLPLGNYAVIILKKHEEK